MPEIAVKDLDEHALFAQALDVMNRAVEANEDKTPYKQLIAASGKIVGDTAMAIGITRRPGGEPYDFYTVRLKGGRLELVGRGKRDEATISWTVTREYLETVVENPDRYVDHPEKLDLDWLKSRLGIG